METVVFERGDHFYLLGPCSPIQPTKTERDELAFADELRSNSPNESLMWLRGQYVEADRPNRNGQLWSSDELAITSLTPRLMPITVMHDPRTAVGLIADTKLLTPDQDNVPRARIDTVLALWQHRFPEVAEECTANYRQGTLMQSMECVPLNTEILTRRGWKRHDDIRPSDETVGYNPDTGRNEWTAIKSVFRKRSDVFSLGNSKWRIECTEGHRWLAATGTRQGSKYVFGKRDMVASRDIDRRHQLVLSAPADLDHPDGPLPISAAEAALIGWIAADGSYNWKHSKRFSASISQSKGDGKMAIELALAACDMPHTVAVREPQTTTRADGVAIHTRMPVSNYSLPARRAQDLWARAELDHLSWQAFVLRLTSEQRHAWLEAMSLAEGNDNHGSRCIAQNPGPLKDAIALASYLDGHRPVEHGADYPGDNAQAAEHIRLCRQAVNGENLHMVNLGPREVWCPETALGTWTMRQGQHILLTGNCSIGSYDCTDCGASFVKLPDGAERANWCTHLSAAAATGIPVRRLRQVSFSGVGLVFGTRRGATGALDTAHLDLQEEVAEFHERANTDRPIRRHRPMDEITIKRDEYDKLKADAAKAVELASRVAALEETSAKVPDLEKDLEAALIATKAAETARDTEKAAKEALEESARAVTLSSDRTGKLGAKFVAALPESIKTRLDEQAKSMTDDEWAIRLEELSELVKVKHDDAAAPATGLTNSLEETSRTQLGGNEPSRVAVSTTLGGLFRQIRPEPTTAGQK